MGRLTPSSFAAAVMPPSVLASAARVTLAFRCDTAAEVDATYAAVEAAGHPGARAPWDSFWGQRYAFLKDPDGNRVDLFAETPAAT